MRQLISDNRKMIEGVDEEKQTGLDYQNREDEAEKRHKEAEEAARKRAEAQERERQTKKRDEADLNADLTKMKQARNKTMARNGDAMTQARRELEARLEGLPEDERNRILEDFDRNQEHLDGMLKEDEARQDSLLKRRLEERRRNRNLAKEALKDKEQQLEAKNNVFREKAEGIDQEFKEGLESLNRDIETERAQEEQKLEDEANKIKKIRLSEYEARLKSARNKAEFNQILEEYQQAQKRVEAEISEQRDKQEKDISNRLKLRKQRKLAELERRKREA